VSILKVHVSLRTSKLERLSVASLFRSGKQESTRKYYSRLKKLTGVNNDDPYKKVHWKLDWKRLHNIQQNDKQQNDNLHEYP
jgi:hypothetical protein